MTCPTEGVYENVRWKIDKNIFDVLTGDTADLLYINDETEPICGWLVGDEYDIEDVENTIKYELMYR